MCPTSNVVISNRFSTLSDHPLQEMREAGLLLGREYRGVAEAHHLDVDELSQIALEGIASTWLDESDRATLTDEFNAVLRSLEPPGV